jgi:LysR family positive regulator for ilvC
LTGTGIEFEKFAKDTLARWEAFQNTLTNQTKVLRGEISMFCTITASYGVLPEILVRFRKSYPEVNIKLLTGNGESAIQRVLEGNIDFAVAALPDRIPDKLRFKPITEIYLQFVGPTIPWPFMSMIHTENIPWEKIPLIVSEKGVARKRIEAWFQSKKIKAHIYAQVSGNEPILAMVSLGFGVGIVPHIVVENTLLNNDVQVLDIRPKIKPYSVGIFVQKRRIKNPLISAFWEII